MRYSLVFLASAVLSGAVIANAVIQKKQFYPSVVYISKSNPSMAVSIYFIYQYSLTMTYLYASFSIDNSVLINKCIRFR